MDDFTFDFVVNVGDVLCGTQTYNMWVGLYIDC